MFAHQTRSLLGAGRKFRVCIIPTNSRNSHAERVVEIQVSVPIRSLSTPTQPTAPATTPETASQPTPTPVAPVAEAAAASRNSRERMVSKLLLTTYKTPAFPAIHHTKPQTKY
ncbi:hypothetical protein N7488_009109 [Penicillium malachiteum]|nr:hypothetical protein N7488_009109 [Penicillium malachiteum]